MSLPEHLQRELLDWLSRVQREAPAAMPGLAAEFARLCAELVAVPESARTGPAAAAAVGFHGLLGSSPPMLALRRDIERFARSDAPVLITGSSGTGKERVAQALHACSRRYGAIFLAENLAAIPDTLIESVLFGHRRGAFTGAVKDHPGHFLAADKGSLFLDEIGELKPALQSKLLRVLQEGEVRAVGASRSRKVDVRILCATNQDLEAAVAAGRFREDLYYRLNVLRLQLPALRERGEDILLLARHFLAQAAASIGRQLVLGDAAAQCLLRYPWPGNVRQLQNEMQRLAALCQQQVVEVADLSAELQA